jgi:hypothetical protein
MKQNTDLTKFFATGGEIKRGKVKRAKGSEQVIYYSVGPLPAIKNKPLEYPRHFSLKKHEWETEESHGTK